MTRTSIQLVCLLGLLLLALSGCDKSHNQRADAAKDTVVGDTQMPGPDATTVDAMLSDSAGPDDLAEVVGETAVPDLVAPIDTTPPPDSVTADAAPDTDGSTISSDVQGTSTKLMLLLNHPNTTADYLRFEVGVISTTADALASGKPYASDEAVDAIKGVGPTTLASLQTFSENWAPDIAHCLLDWVNDPTKATKDALIAAGATTLAADNLLKYRDTDGNKFDSPKELDQVSQVGPATIRQLQTAAGCGMLDAMNTKSVANLSDIAFFSDGDALIVGQRQQGTPHILRFYETNPDAMDALDDPSRVADASFGAAAMDIYSVAFITKDGKTRGLLVGEGKTISSFDPDTDQFGATLGDLDGIHNRVRFNGETAVIANLDQSKVLTYKIGDAKPSELFSVTLNNLLVRADGVIVVLRDNGLLGSWNGQSLVDEDTGQKAHLYGASEHVSSDRFLVVGAKGLALLKSAGEYTRLTSLTAQTLKDVAISPDGTFALLVGAGGTVIRYLFASGEVSRLSTGTTADLEAVAFSRHKNSAYHFALIVGRKGTVLKYTPPPKL